jgi:predicted nucleic acid-binding protein
VWIEHLRRTQSRAHLEFRELATTDPTSVDCLIAAVALRHETAVWHCDEDYVRIAGVSDLRQRDLR